MPKKSNLWPWALTAAALAITVALFVRETPPLESERPLADTVAQIEWTELQRVPARLAEDPFAAVDRDTVARPPQSRLLQNAKNSMKKGFSREEFDVPRLIIDCDRSVAAPIGQQWWSREPLGRDFTLPPATALAEIRRSLAARLSAGTGQVHVMLVPLFGGRFQDASEIRRRTRVAVVSSLATEGYVPVDSQHLGLSVLCLHAEIAELAGHSPRTIGRMRIAFEQFDLAAGEASKTVLLIYLDDEALTSGPYVRLAQLLREVLPETDIDSWKLRVSMIGPAGTDGLRALVRDSDAVPKWLSPMRIYSHSATGNVPDQPSRQSDAAFAKPPAGVVGEPPEIVPLIGTNKRLAELLLAELDRRKPPARDTERRSAGMCHSVLAIVAESDSQYARDLVQHLGSGSDARLLCTRTFFYSRGVDGSTLTARTNAESDRPGRDRPATGPAAGERPGGDSAAALALAAGTVERGDGLAQFDYLRTLGEMLARGYRAGEKAAPFPYDGIIIAGTDVYDKLLVMQALRPAVPRALFMTTDFDARYQYASQAQWTRNLVIATHYGPELPARVPPARCDANHSKSSANGTGQFPYRDGYQTAAHRAVSRAIEDATCGDPAGSGKPLSEARKAFDEETPPLVYEVGRTQLIALDAGAKAPASEPDGVQATWIAAFFALVLALWSWLHYGRSAALVTVTLAVVVQLVLYLSWRWVDASFTEPSELTQGVSLAAPFAIRVLALVATIGAIAFVAWCGHALLFGVGGQGGDEPGRVATAFAGGVFVIGACVIAYDAFATGPSFSAQALSGLQALGYSAMAVAALSCAFWRRSRSWTVTLDHTVALALAFLLSWCVLNQALGRSLVPWVRDFELLRWNALLGASLAVLLSVLFASIIAINLARERNLHRVLDGWTTPETAGSQSAPWNARGAKWLAYPPFGILVILAISGGSTFEAGGFATPWLVWCGALSAFIVVSQLRLQRAAEKVQAAVLAFNERSPGDAKWAMPGDTHDLGGVEDLLTQPLLRLILVPLGAIGGIEGIEWITHLADFWR